MRTLSNFVLASAIFTGVGVYMMRTAHAQIVPSAVWSAPAVPITSCAWPSIAVSPVPAGNIAYCNTTQGMAQSLSPSTTFTLIQGVAGPAGPTGPAGPQGPAGPAGTLPATFTCTGFTSVTTGGITLSGCP